MAIYPDAGLDFFYDVQRDLPTDTEPINHSSGDRGRWITDAQQALGVSSVHQYIRSVREEHGTDWTLAAFVVDSLADSDGKSQGSQILDTFFKAHCVKPFCTEHLNGLDGEDAIRPSAVGNDFLIFR